MLFRSAWAITEHLHDAVGCRSLFATHSHELARLADRLPGLRTDNVLVQEGPDDVVFLHRVAPGSADKSYGLPVARLAGVPGEVLERTEPVLGELEGRQGTWRARGRVPQAQAPRGGGRGLRNAVAGLLACLLPRPASRAGRGPRGQASLEPLEPNCSQGGRPWR